MHILMWWNWTIFEKRVPILKRDLVSYFVFVGEANKSLQGDKMSKIFYLQYFKMNLSKIYQQIISNKAITEIKYRFKWQWIFLAKFLSSHIHKYISINFPALMI